MALVDQNYNSGASTLLIDASANRSVSNANGTNGISRLSQMQARFQQRQLQEKEQKLLRLYESQQQRAFQRVGRGSAGSSSVSSTTSSTTSSSSLGNGKVRQLFDERRTGGKAATAGWDRSYPLEPLDTRRQTRSNGHHQQITRGASLERISSYAQPVKKAVARSKSQVRPGNLVNGGYADRNRHQEYSDPEEEYNYIHQDESDSPYSRDKNQNRYNSQDREIDQLFTHSRPSLYDNEEPLRDGETFDESQLFKKLSNVGGILLMKERTMNEDKYKTYNANSRKPAAAAPAVTNRTTPMRRPVNGATTTPARTTMTTTTAARPVARKVELAPSPPPPRSTAAPPRKGVPPKSTATASPAPLRPSSNFNRTSPAPAPAASRSVGPRAVPPASPAKAVPSRPGPRATAPPADNLAECKICGRRFATDRVEMHETICARTGQKKRKVFDPVKQRVKGTEAEAYVRQAAKQKVPVKEAAPKKSDWRRKHEEFINAIRAAKEVKAHLAAGGKLSDLPPPPPSENLDYVQCPHCSRRFNETAAERHIPRCADMQHNKPKPKASAAKGGVTPKKRY